MRNGVDPWWQKYQKVTQMTPGLETQLQILPVSPHIISNYNHLHF